MFDLQIHSFSWFVNEAPLSTKSLESKLTCDIQQRIPREPGLG